MLDFMMISTRTVRKGRVEVDEIYPSFIINTSKDLMIRGGDFYAIWDKENSCWTTDENRAFGLIDRELDIYKEEHYKDTDTFVRVLHMRNGDSGMVDKWRKYCTKQMRESYHELDEKLIFSNSKLSKRDYASKSLGYALEKGDISAYDKLISTLYSKEERHKIEWAIGSIVSGDSKKIQKFLVLYGAAGTGKSTILNIIQQLFDGYYTVFDAKALGSSNSAFALEAFRSNPLVAIQHDGDLSRIEDNTRLNSLVSHELMTVNEKFKSTYTSRFKCFLFMGTNKPVKITDGRSGLLRRLIDVSPSGNKMPVREYNAAMKEITFELGAIAEHCLSVYESNPGKYDDYIPTSMLGASNDFYNYMIDNYHIFLRDNGTTLKAAWELYKDYTIEAHVPYPLSQRLFKEELKNYFWVFNDRFNLDDGSRVRSYYSGFRTDKFIEEKKEDELPANQIEFKEQESIFDKICAGCPAQYANDEGLPKRKWANVDTILTDISTKELHYVRIPEEHIVIDFDLKDKNGNKSFERNLEEASKWPNTYAELSKSGGGIHLHYIYSGDPHELDSKYDEDIEVKVFKGNSSLRRKLTKCNDLPIATISSGLPKKKGDKRNMVDFTSLKNEAALRKMIDRNLNKEIHASTKPSVDFIFKILEDAYNGDLSYDVSDMQNDIFAFGAQSSHQSEACLKLIAKMHFKSKDVEELESKEADGPLYLYDIEVYPNLLLVCWAIITDEIINDINEIMSKGKREVIFPEVVKYINENIPVFEVVNPSPQWVEEFLGHRIGGFNNRRYDDHLMVARAKGSDIPGIYDLSHRIVSGDTTAYQQQGWKAGYLDILDFASAGNKKSLKKLEFEMGFHHQELGYAWDQPIDIEKWSEVISYCHNDVRATVAAFFYLSADWAARLILSDWCSLPPSTTTNTLTTRIIFDKDKTPQGEFCYRDLSKPVIFMDRDVNNFLREACPVMMSQKHGDEKSMLPYFPGYEYYNGKSTYRGEEVGEGGYVYAEPGIYENVALLDISSMHPHSIISECLFGPKYTRTFRDIVRGRVSIKHEDWDELGTLLDGKLTPYAEKVKTGEITSKDLANALKTGINSVYGLTAAAFDNPFNDPRNKDNIVAKRGALFMVDLKHEVQKRGFTVAHIKTDSIKIPNATPEIIQFVMDFGEKYGYSFEHEATYKKMCLVNDAVYIAQYDNGKWTATGKEFQVPYVFKTLFSHEDIVFEDLCETMSVTTALYLDTNEALPEGEHDYHFIGRVGEFCPVRENCGGGVLLRQGTDREGNVKYSAATGSKGYRWIESELVRPLWGAEDPIDYGYFDKKVKDAIKHINEFGSFEEFIKD